MSYGLTPEEVGHIVSPTLLQQAPWGERLHCTPYQTQYSLQRLNIRPHGVQPMGYYVQTRGTYFVEEGGVLVRSRTKEGVVAILCIEAGHSLAITPGFLHGLCGLQESVVYFFTNRPVGEDYYVAEMEEEAQHHYRQLRSMAAPKGRETLFDVRAKYWGSIASIVSEEFVGKRLVLQQGGQSSLEFHCQKAESYYLHSGKIKVGLRVGRGQNHSVILKSGQGIDIPSGLMHMRIALEESLLFEVSTPDSDRDSHLVEDGRTYQHIE